MISHSVSRLVEAAAAGRDAPKWQFLCHAADHAGYFPLLASIHGHDKSGRITR